MRDTMIEPEMIEYHPVIHRLLERYAELRQGGADLPELSRLCRGAQGYNLTMHPRQAALGLDQRTIIARYLWVEEAIDGENVEGEALAMIWQDDASSTQITLYSPETGTAYVTASINTRHLSQVSLDPNEEVEA